MQPPFLSLWKVWLALVLPISQGSFSWLTLLCLNKSVALPLQGTSRLDKQWRAEWAARWVECREAVLTGFINYKWRKRTFLYIQLKPIHSCRFGNTDRMWAVMCEWVQFHRCLCFCETYVEQYANSLTCTPSFYRSDQPIAPLWSGVGGRSYCIQCIKQTRYM